MSRPVPGGSGGAGPALTPFTARTVSHFNEALAALLRNDAADPLAAALDAFGGDLDESLVRALAAGGPAGNLVGDAGNEAGRAGGKPVPGTDGLAALLGQPPAQPASLPRSTDPAPIKKLGALFDWDAAIGDGAAAERRLAAARATAGGAATTARGTGVSSGGAVRVPVVPPVVTQAQRVKVTPGSGGAVASPSKAQRVRVGGSSSATTGAPSSPGATNAWHNSSSSSSKSAPLVSLSPSSPSKGVRAAHTGPVHSPLSPSAVDEVTKARAAAKRNIFAFATLEVPAFSRTAARLRGSSATTPSSSSQPGRSLNNSGLGMEDDEDVRHYAGGQEFDRAARSAMLAAAMGAADADAVGRVARVVMAAMVDDDEEEDEGRRGEGRGGSSTGATLTAQSRRTALPVAAGGPSSSDVSIYLDASLLAAASSGGDHGGRAGAVSDEEEEAAIYARLRRAVAGPDGGSASEEEEEARERKPAALPVPLASPLSLPVASPPAAGPAASPPSLSDAGSSPFNVTLFSPQTQVGTSPLASPPVDSVSPGKQSPPAAHPVASSSNSSGDQATEAHALAAPLGASAVNDSAWLLDDSNDKSSGDEEEEAGGLYLAASAVTVAPPRPAGVGPVVTTPALGRGGAVATPGADTSAGWSPVSPDSLLMLSPGGATTVKKPAGLLPFSPQPQLPPFRLPSPLPAPAAALHAKEEEEDDEDGGFLSGEAAAAAVAAAQSQWRQDERAFAVSEADLAAAEAAEAALRAAARRGDVLQQPATPSHAVSAPAASIPDADASPSSSWDFLGGDGGASAILAASAATPSSPTLLFFNGEAVHSLARSGYTDLFASRSEPLGSLSAAKPSPITIGVSGSSADDGSEGPVFRGYVSALGDSHASAAAAPSGDDTRLEASDLAVAGAPVPPALQTTQPVGRAAVLLQAKPSATAIFLATGSHQPRPRLRLFLAPDGGDGTALALQWLGPRAPLPLTSAPVPLRNGSDWVITAANGAESRQPLPVALGWHARLLTLQATLADTAGEDGSEGNAGISVTVPLAVSGGGTNPLLQPSFCDASTGALLGADGSGALHLRPKQVLLLSVAADLAAALGPLAGGEDADSSADELAYSLQRGLAQAALALAASHLRHGVTLALECTVAASLALTASTGASQSSHTFTLPVRLQFPVTVDVAPLQPAAVVPAVAAMLPQSPTSTAGEPRTHLPVRSASPALAVSEPEDGSGVPSVAAVPALSAAGGSSSGSAYPAPLTAAAYPGRRSPLPRAAAEASAISNSRSASLSRAASPSGGGGGYASGGEGAGAPFLSAVTGTIIPGGGRVVAPPRGQVKGFPAPAPAPSGVLAGRGSRSVSPAVAAVAAAVAAVPAPRVVAPSAPMPAPAPSPAVQTSLAQLQQQPAPSPSPVPPVSNPPSRFGADVVAYLARGKGGGGEGGSASRSTSPAGGNAAAAGAEAGSRSSRLPMSPFAVSSKPQPTVAPAADAALTLPQERGSPARVLGKQLRFEELPDGGDDEEEGGDDAPSFGSFSDAEEGASVPAETAQQQQQPLQLESQPAPPLPPTAGLASPAATLRKRLPAAPSAAGEEAGSSPGRPKVVTLGGTGTGATAAAAKRGKLPPRVTAAEAAEASDALGARSSIVLGSGEEALGGRHTAGPRRGGGVVQQPQLPAGGIASPAKAPELVLDAAATAASAAAPPAVPAAAAAAAARGLKSPLPRRTRPAAPGGTAAFASPVSRKAAPVAGTDGDGEAAPVPAGARLKQRPAPAAAATSSSAGSGAAPLAPPITSSSSSPQQTGKSGGAGRNLKSPKGPALPAGGIATPAKLPAEASAAPAAGTAAAAPATPLQTVAPAAALPSHHFQAASSSTSEQEGDRAASPVSRALPPAATAAGTTSTAAVSNAQKLPARPPGSAVSSSLGAPVSVAAGPLASPTGGAGTSVASRAAKKEKVTRAEATAPPPLQQQAVSPPRASAAATAAPANMLASPQPPASWLGSPLPSFKPRASAVPVAAPQPLPPPPTAWKVTSLGAGGLLQVRGAPLRGSGSSGPSLAAVAAAALPPSLAQLLDDGLSSTHRQQPPQPAALRLAAAPAPPTGAAPALLVFRGPDGKPLPPAASGSSLPLPFLTVTPPTNLLRRVALTGSSGDGVEVPALALPAGAALSVYCDVGLPPLHSGSGAASALTPPDGYVRLSSGWSWDAPGRCVTGSVTVAQLAPAPANGGDDDGAYAVSPDVQPVSVPIRVHEDAWTARGWQLALIPVGGGEAIAFLPGTLPPAAAAPVGAPPTPLMQLLAARPVDTLLPQVEVVPAPLAAAPAPVPPSAPAVAAVPPAQEPPAAAAPFSPLPRPRKLDFLSPLAPPAPLQTPPVKPAQSQRQEPDLAVAAAAPAPPPVPGPGAAFVHRLTARLATAAASTSTSPALGVPPAATPLRTALAGGGSGDHDDAAAPGPTRKQLPEGNVAGRLLRRLEEAVHSAEAAPVASASVEASVSAAGASSSSSSGVNGSPGRTAALRASLAALGDASCNTTTLLDETSAVITAAAATAAAAWKGLPEPAHTAAFSPLPRHTAAAAAGSGAAAPAAAPAAPALYAGPPVAPAPTAQQQQPPSLPLLQPPAPGLQVNVRQLSFPDTLCGASVRLRVQVCNTATQPLRVRVLVAPLPEAPGDALAFRVKRAHSTVQLAPRTFCMLPVTFAPLPQLLRGENGGEAGGENGGEAGGASQMLRALLVIDGEVEGAAEGAASGSGGAPQQLRTFAHLAGRVPLLPGR